MSDTIVTAAAQRRDGPATDAPLVLTARAKINLALHVVGQRADGHHLLESLVTFADAGDRLSLRPAPADAFTVSGPFAALVPQQEAGRGADAGTNLVLRARDLLRLRLRPLGHACGPVHLHLNKCLPVASGVGGGSADAAAALIGLCRLWEADAASLDLAALGLALGADLPMCLAGHPLIARGIGEAISRVAGLPAFAALLVNPGVAVLTPAVFRALTEKVNPPLILPDGLSGRAAWLAALAALRNDLEPPARALAPVISEVADALRSAGAALTRMSGSGATCFSLFHDDAARDRAAAKLREARPGWFLLPCTTMES